MEDLKTTWEDLINLVSMAITLRKFQEGEYNEDWDEGEKAYTDYNINARIKYELTERDFTLLGEDMLLDAVVVIRKNDLDAQSLTVTSNDRFKINTVDYRITKLKPHIVGGQQVGFIMGVREVMQTAS
jgi:hypothetical protein